MIGVAALRPGDLWKTAGAVENALPPPAPAFPTAPWTAPLAPPHSSHRPGDDESFRLKSKMPRSETRRYINR